MGKERKVYDFVQTRLDAGEQAFFVYPLIDPDKEKKSAVAMFQNLSKDIFPGFPCALIHSRLDDEAKSAAIKDFRLGKIKVLVSTTVIEVGVNIPNASCIVIEHAELFGLSALHQLRGRVGRGEDQGYCFLVYSPDLSDDAKQRMKIMMEENDGFAIAEKDLALRGPGELTGNRQSGYCSSALIKAIGAPERLGKIRDAAADLLADDPLLEKPEHKTLSRFLESRQWDEPGF
jgi:ATP-dependent DNA helicase RecG